jgi:hypothetical protein
MSVREQALTAAVLKVLADEIAAQLQVAKNATEHGFRETETTQAVPQLADGTKVATVTWAGGDGKTASVTNPDALLGWVQENHPSETEVIVRDSYRKKLLDTAKKEGRAIDPLTGELVPGITVGESKPYVSIRFRPGGQDAIVAAWRSGELARIEVVAPLAIEDGAA